MEIRNFCIIAHVDHGKSTLADRFLEITKTVPLEKLEEQFLDRMELERERRVTIKMQPVRMEYEFLGKKYILNLIDTPGHVDFSYEVSRALKAVEGAILLVDVQKGIQAQTFSNYLLAKENGLLIIPVLNKIDLQPPDLKEKKKELADLTSFPLEKISQVSAKTGEGVKILLQRVIKEIPSPEGKIDFPFSALIFDTEYDEHLGIIVHIRVKDGVIRKGEEIKFFHQREKFKVRDLGVFTPFKKSSESLMAGEVGWVATGIKEPEKVFIGDTLLKEDDLKKKRKVFVFKGFRKPQPVVFTNIYPDTSVDFEVFKKAFEKIYLTDPALEFKEISTSLGRGLLCGFLGLFHLEITLLRLEREQGLKSIVTLPTVIYKVETRKGEEIEVKDVSSLPSLGEIKRILEPRVKLEVVVPQRFVNEVMSLLPIFRAELLETRIIGNNVILELDAPLSKIIQNFDDALKSKTQGFGSFSYELTGWREADIVKLEIIVAREKQPALSFLIHRSEAQKMATEMVDKLKKYLPRAQFPIVIQGAINGKVVVRREIPALKKNVTAPLYGGDFTRKKKLLVKQREGKKKLMRAGRVRIPPEIFIKILRKS